MSVVSKDHIIRPPEGDAGCAAVQYPLLRRAGEVPNAGDGARHEQLAGERMHARVSEAATGAQQGLQRSARVSIPELEGLPSIGQQGHVAKRALSGVKMKRSMT